MTSPSAGTWVVAGLSAAAHLVVGVFYVSSGLVAPGWAVAVLLVWWVLLAVQLSRLALHGSWWTPAVPVVGFASWYVVLTVGERLLGWTA
jgi:hypothetical protein